MLKKKVWPEENFGNVELQMSVDQFREILQKRNCVIGLSNAECQVLKNFMVPLIKNNKVLPYLDIWKQVFTNSKLKSERYTYSKYYLSCHSQMLNWEECFHEC